MTELVIRGLKRRRKDIVYIVLVSFIATFFMSGVLMFQSILDSYVTEKNRDTYGDWVVAAGSPEVSHAYLTEKGSISTSLSLCTEEGNLLPKWLGSISQELLSFGRIHLYEGRMPKNSTEIVSDLQTLQKLGYSYDLGQIITIHWNAAGGELPGVREKSYTLVGTVKPFNQLWIKGAEIRYPDLLVTEEELQSFGEEITTSWFYRLDPSLPEIDTTEFFDSLQKRFPKVPLTFNGYVYGSSIWGSEGNYNAVIGMMIVLSVVSIVFVLSAYVDKRRAAYYRLRMIGCPRTRLNGIIAAECGLPALIPALLALGFSYLAGASICRIIAKSVNLHGFFGFEPPVFFLQLAAILGTVSAAVLLTMLRTSDRRIAQESRALSGKEIRRLRKALPKLSLPEKDLFRRQRILHPALRIASLLFSVIVTMFLSMCLRNVVGAIRTAKSAAAEPDYVISIRNPEVIARKYDYVSEDGTVFETDPDSPGSQKDYYDPYYGPTDEELLYLRSVPGVSGMEGSVWDNWHLLRWEGIEDSPRPLEARYTVDQIVYTEQVNELFAGVNTVTDLRFLKTYFKERGESFPEEDYEAFKDGRLCFVLGNNGSRLDIETGEMITVPDETLQNGELLTIFSENNEEGLKIPVRIVENDAPLWSEYFTVNREGLPVFISEKTAEALRQLETPLPEFRENHFLLRFDRFSSFEATDKVLAAFVSGKPNSEYFNNAERKRHTIQENVVRPLLIFGSLMLMTIAVFLIVQRNLSEIRCRQSLGSMRRFRRIGMQAREVRIRLFASEAFESGAVFAGFSAWILWSTLQSFITHKKTLGGPHDEAAFCNLTKSWTQNPYLMTLDSLLSLNTLFTVLAILLFFVILTLFCYEISRKTAQNEEVL